MIYWHCCQTAEENKVMGRERRSRAKLEMVTIDLQPHAGNAAWLHQLPHAGLCNSLDAVHSHDPAPIHATFVSTAGLISGGRKIFDKIKFLRSEVMPLCLPVERNSSCNENGSAPHPQFTNWKPLCLQAPFYINVFPFFGWFCTPIRTVSCLKSPQYGQEIHSVGLINIESNFVLHWTKSKKFTLLLSVKMSCSLCVTLHYNSCY